MRIVVGMVVAVAVGTAIACGVTDTSSPAAPQAKVAAAQKGGGAGGGGGPPEVVPAPHRHFRAHLSSREEVPPNPSRAQGQANFTLAPDGQSLHFRINIANIVNTTQAHIHLAPEGQNGPIVVWLRPSGPPLQLVPGRLAGPYAEGTITSANLVGQMAGQPLSTLIAAMRAGNTYVNVHTLVHPGGEIRGQIR